MLKSVKNQVWDQVRHQVWDQVRDQFWVQVWNQVGRQVLIQVRDQVEDQVSGKVEDKKQVQVAVDTHQPGTTPLTRVVRKIFNAFKSGPIAHTEEVCSMANEYTNSPLGIPIPYHKETNKQEPQKKGSNTTERKSKL